MKIGRRGFLSPPEEIWKARDLLSRAADAHLNSHGAQARNLLQECDFAALRSFRSRIVENEIQEVIRFRKVPNAPRHAATKTKARMPSKQVELSIFERDGWHCRFCEIPVIDRTAIRVLDRAYPDVVRWSQTPYKNRHAALNVMCVSLDHILPHSRGGSNDPDNLVAACGCCQFGRNQYTLDEVGFADPFSVPPIQSDWDGLRKIIL